MAYKTIGQVLKAKDGGMDYIKINEDVVFKKGDTLSLQNKASKLASIQKGLASGKLTEELAAKLTEQAERQQDFVRFEIVNTKG